MRKREITPSDPEWNQEFLDKLLRKNNYCKSCGKKIKWKYTKCFDCHMKPKMKKFKKQMKKSELKVITNRY